MNRRDWLKLAGLSSAGLMIAPGLKGMPFAAPAPLTRAAFGPDFQWGVATAAYQIEGAHDLDGKGESVWDRFTHTPKKIDNNDNGDRACDFYHKYPEDIELMRSMNIPNNRFSIAWSRVLPEGTGKVNEKGIDFYNRVIDTSLEKGVEPWVTCYHWDLPQALEDKGGWPSRDILGPFEEYVDLITRRFGDRVKKWMVLNEPAAFVGLGYFLGMHAPGRKGLKNFLPAIHHATLAQAEGGRIIRRNVPDAEIGTTFSAAHFMPKNEKKKMHHKSAARYAAGFNRLFLEPALGLGYPIDTIPPLKRIKKFFEPGDEEKMVFDFDFIGLQNYTRDVIRHSLMIPFLWGKSVDPAKRPDHGGITEMNWEVYPEGIYHLLKWMDGYPQIKKILVTENGCAFPDSLKDGRIQDTERKQFIQDYLGQVLRAKNEGVNVQGYFVWSFMDNFEWAEGYHPRFGLVRVDFETLERTIKDSGLWYRDFLATK